MVSTRAEPVARQCTIVKYEGKERITIYNSLASVICNKVYVNTSICMKHHIEKHTMRSMTHRDWQQPIAITLIRDWVKPVVVWHPHT